MKKGPEKSDIMWEIEQRELSASSPRPTCLIPFGPAWTQPTGSEVTMILELAKLNSAEAAQLAGIPSGGRTVRRWKSGQSPIPYAAWALLCHTAGFREIFLHKSLDK